MNFKKIFIPFYLLIFLSVLANLANAQCGGQYAGTPYNVTQTSAALPVNDSVSGSFTYYIEFGSPGFTPGTNANAGAGGTVVIKPAGQTVVVTGLTPATNYQLFVRKTCGAGIWSANSQPKNFFTAYNCTGLINLSCGNMVTNNFISGVGAWYNCGGGEGREIIYSFTPAVSGMHVLFIPPHPGRVDYSYKPQSGGCSETGTTCIGYNFNSGIRQISFGPLTAGVAYYLRADPGLSTPLNSTTFRIECPYCAQPANVVLSNYSAVGFTVNYSGNSGLLEYGPAGFIPGTGSSAGVNGTILTISNGSAVSGLSPSTNYDVYIRSLCAGNYGPNSILVNAATYNCPPVITYSTLNSVYQINNFGFTFPYGVYGTSSVCFPGFGEEQIMKFTPPSAGNYDVYVNRILSAPNGNPDVMLTLSTRQSPGNCGLANYVCRQPVSSIQYYDTYAVNFPAGGLSYDMLFDSMDSAASGMVSISIECGKPTAASASSITSSSAVINFNCNCPDTTYLEYGPSGFTPGTGNTAGSGTLISNVSSPKTISGLSAYTAYDAYLRTNCGGSFSSNVPVSFKTLHNCGNEPLLACGTNFTVNLNTSGGFWSTYNCGTLNANSSEYLYRFIPSQTGNYTINNVSSIGYYLTPLNVYYKLSGGSCDATGWSCAGTLTNAPQSLNFGPLTGGATYLILFDGTFANNTKTINIACFQCNATINAVGNTTFCQGGNVLLQADTGTGITYHWYNNGAAIPGATLSSLNVNATGNYFVIENKSCGQATSQILTITVFPLPTAPVTASGPLTFCNGDSVTLSTTSFAGETFKWKKNNGIINGATAQSFTAKYAGSYKVVKTNSNGCSVTSSAYAVTVNFNPNATVTPQGSLSFCAGDSVKLAGNSGTALTYQWKKNNGNIPGATAKNYIAKTAGSYKLKVTSSNGCTKISAPVAVTVPCRENEGVPGLGVSVYPNPGSGEFNLELKNPVDLITGLKVYDVTGRVILNKSYRTVNGLINFSLTAPGIYKAVITNGTEMKQVSIVKTE